VDTKPDKSRPANFSTWTLLRQSLFRGFLLASLVSNIGTWMHDVGASWLMASFTSSPLMVALVQAAMSLPVFLFALPAGALADILDRRRLLIGTQCWMLLVAGILAATVMMGVINLWILLFLTFLLSTGAALNGPAWQAVVPEMVEPEELPSAVTLRDIFFNISRIAGPALGGFIIAATGEPGKGAGAVFFLNSVSFLGVVMVLLRWRRMPRPTAAYPEGIAGAIHAGMRYVRHAAEVRNILIRAGAFILFESALWATLPLFAQSELKISARGYGVLIACLGLGAITGGAFFPYLRQKFSTNALVSGATILAAVMLIVLASAHSFFIASFTVLMSGTAWLTIIMSFNITLLETVPDWVRSRVMAVFQFIFFGCFAGGSLIWGLTAKKIGMPGALVCAGLGIMVQLAVLSRCRISGKSNIKLKPLGYPLPETSYAIKAEGGPVMVTVEHRIRSSDVKEFENAMQEVRRIRLRDGATQWWLFHDSAKSGRYVETFIVKSWAEHMRQHERLTVADFEVEQRARSYHTSDTPLVINHLIDAYSPSHDKMEISVTKKSTSEAIFLDIELS
jgi:MFS family permease